MNPQEFLDGGTVRVAEPTYAICRTDDPVPTAFATLNDDTETTVVVDEAAGIPADAGAVSRDWKRLTFEMDLPFELVGFLAAVATTLAEADVSVFVLSTYSTDHVLVRRADLDVAVQQLETLGCAVV
jgi:hypothetical protein